MSISYSSENIVSMFNAGEFDVIVHGCNCFCTMGKGLAKALRDLHPEIYEADQRTTEGDHEKLGCIDDVYVGNEQWVVNAYSQFQYGNEGVFINYAALEKIMEALNKLAERLSVRLKRSPRICMPLIGGTNAGGDPMFIREIIQRKAGDLDITVFTKSANESRDKTRLVGYLITRNDNLLEGAKALARYKRFTAWLKIMSKESVFFCSAAYFDHSAFKTLLQGRVYIHGEEPPEYFGEAVYDNNLDRGLLRARDFCNANYLKSLVILGDAELIAQTMGYLDAIIHTAVDYQSLDPASWQYIEREADMPNIPEEMFKEGRSDFSQLREEGVETGLLTKKVYYRKGKKTVDLSDL